MDKNTGTERECHSKIEAESRMMHGRATELQGSHQKMREAWDRLPIKASGRNGRNQPC